MRPSRTAQLAAAVRAYHLMHDHPPLLEDSAANWLIGPPLSVVLRTAPLRWLFFERVLARVRPVRVSIVVRSRYAEDCLASAIRAGCRQYVILGAGLDSWALRNEAPDVRVFELDHPQTQEWKESRLRARLGTLPSHLVLIPIDFERQAIADVLSGHQFDRDSPTFVSWLGTIYYLTREAIRSTLNSLGAVCAPGSKVVFDYIAAKRRMTPPDIRLLEEADRVGTRRGEPLRTLLEADEVGEMLHSAGFRVSENLSAPEVRSRYLRGRSDGLDVPGFMRLCCAERERAA